MGKKVIITGASGGFGALTVKTLLKEGHSVAASMRQAETKNKAAAEELSALGAKIVEIDVSSDQSVNRGVEESIEKLGGLDVVINNAGIGVLGIQEQFTIEDFQKLFEVNVFGVQRINRAALPYLRKQQSGLLIFISSVLGRISLPFYGPYNASKWAVEALAESCRMELASFGIESCIVEPGGYPTSFFDNLLKASDQSTSDGYGEMAKMPKQMFDSLEDAFADNPNQDPQNVADAINKIIQTPAGERAIRTVVDQMGMGSNLEAYNQQLNQIHSGILESFGMGEMTKLKS